MNYTIFYVAIFLIALMVINAYLSPIVIKELFLNDDQMKLISLNKLSSTSNNTGICGRNLVFPHFKDATILASERAMPDSSITSNPIGTCRFNKDINDSYSIIYENGLFYNLKSACIKLNLNDIAVFNSGTEVILDVKGDNAKLLYLLNPLWVEFIPSSDRTTLAYTLKHTTPLYTNQTATQKMYFNCLVSYNKGASDNLFNYKKLSPTQTELNQQDVSTCKSSGNINIKVYYLDDLSANFQSIGRSLSLENLNLLATNNNSIYKIFDVKYDKILNQVRQKEIYEFMNNINLMYKNFTTPVFTFDFSIITNPIKKTEQIMHCYMDNDVGEYNACKILDNSPKKVNNICMFTLTPNQTGSILKCFTGTTNGDCGSDESILISKEDTPILELNLPLMSNDVRITIMATITPYNRILYAEWNDIYNKDSKKQCGFVSNQSCNKRVSQNALYNLFAERTNRAQINNIYINCNENIVSKVNGVYLGYKNIYNSKYLI